MQLLDGTDINLSPTSSKQILDITDVRDRREFEKLSGRFTNINYDNERWIGLLTVRTVNRSDMNIMETLANSKQFKILPGELCPDTGTHALLPFLRGGDVWVNGDLQIRNNGFSANQSVLELSLPLLTIAAADDEEDEPGIDGNTFSITKDDGTTINFGYDGGFRVYPQSVAKERGRLDYIDGTTKKIDYDRDTRTAARIRFETTNPNMYKVAALLRQAEQFSMRPRSFATLTSPASQIDGINPNYTFECEMAGGLTIKTAEYNYTNGKYDIEFDMLVYLRDNSELFILFEEFMRDFIQFMANGQEWDAWEYNGMGRIMGGFVDFMADDNNFTLH